MRSLRRLSIAAVGLIVLATTGGFTAGRGNGTPAGSLSPTGVTVRFRGLAAVSASVAWVAGTAGTVLRTTTGGRSWQSVGPADAAALQFRDIEAFDRDHAVALTIGEGDQSRVYVTANGGRSWTETFRNDEPAAFYDCMTFLDRRHGLALSDPVDGKFRILATTDGGHSWTVRSGAGMPAALDGEFAFAASGTCLVSSGHDAWFASGGGSVSRVFRTTNFGRTWSVVDSPIPSGASAGIYSLAFRDPWHGIAVGGDFATPTVAPDGSATTRTGGRTWTVSRTVPGEYRSGSAWARGDTALAVAPTGSRRRGPGGRTRWRLPAG